MSGKIICPQCKTVVKEYQHPSPTVDIIIECVSDDAQKGIVLIERKNFPFGWALPGGFVDYGETLEQAAVREAKEETCLDVELIRQFHSYSDPARDSRQHTISIVFIARAQGNPKGVDDARRAIIASRENIPEEIAFDHRQILEDYFNGLF